MISKMSQSLSSLTKYLSELAESIKERTSTIVLVFFGVVGFLFLADKVRSYVRMLLSLFIIPGKNVSLNPLFEKPRDS